MKGSVWSVSDGRQQKKCVIPSPRFFSRNGVCAVTPEHTSSLYSVATSGAMYTYMDGREASWKRRSRNKHGVMQTCTRGSKSFSALNLGPPLTLLRLSRALSAAVALELSGESCLSRSLGDSRPRDSHFPLDKGSRSRSHRNTFFCGRPFHSFVAQSHRNTHVRAVTSGKGDTGVASIRRRHRDIRNGKGSHFHRYSLPPPYFQPLQYMPHRKCRVMKHHTGKASSS